MSVLKNISSTFNKISKPIAKLAVAVFGTMLFATATPAFAENTENPIKNDKITEQISIKLEKGDKEPDRLLVDIGVDTKYGNFNVYFMPPNENGYRDLAIGIRPECANHTFPLSKLVNLNLTNKFGATPSLGKIGWEPGTEIKYKLTPEVSIAATAGVALAFDLEDEQVDAEARGGLQIAFKR